MYKSFLIAVVTSYAVAVKIRDDVNDAADLTSIEPPKAYSTDEFFAGY